jgi:hypothetical protein
LTRSFCLSGPSARSALVASLLAATAAAAGAGPFFMGPYKHAPLALDPGTLLMRSAVTGTVRPVADLLGEGEVLHWAFATGECGEERWGEGVDTDAFARANAPAFVQARRRYVVSTGGEGGHFSCGSDAGFERFIRRYDSPMLAGIDLDIEAKQTDADIDALVRRVKAALPKHRHLRFSFTLPTWAGSDAERRGLNRLGERVLQALKRHGLQRAPQVVINLMVMNYGDAEARSCVVKTTEAGEPRCDMGASAAQAARNLHTRHGWPLARIAVTAMPGVNDVRLNVTTLDDARRIGADARALGLAGVHFWSLDRDRACDPPAPDGASALCSGLPQAPLDFGRAFKDGANP